VLCARRHNPFHPPGVERHVALPSNGRRRFVDELVYERLNVVLGELTLKPARLLSAITTRMITTITAQGYASLARGGVRGMEQSILYHVFKELPMGAHFIPVDDRAKPKRTREQAGAEHLLRALAKGPAAARARARAALLDADEHGSRDDPAVRLAFAAKLDARTHEIQDRQIVLQQFYECRIAALERYVSFCVLFHAMAAQSARPWLRRQWDTARSQSNLRVATTASPVSASDAHSDSERISAEGVARRRHAALTLRRLLTHF